MPSKTVEIEGHEISYDLTDSIQKGHIEWLEKLPEYKRTKILSGKSFEVIEVDEHGHVFSLSKPNRIGEREFLDAA